MVIVSKSVKSQYRRQFLQAGPALLASSSLACAGPRSTPISSGRPGARSPNDVVRVGAIGLGIMGTRNCEAAMQVPGVELAKVCDLYEGRLAHARQAYGAAIATTRDYQEVLDDPKIDAVLISSTDHWHKTMAIEAMRKRKAVYCEKPMVHRIDEGLPFVAAQRETGSVCQIGSQRVSSAVYAKARELYASGAIGQLVVAEAYWDRQSAMGAWQYSIPRDASAKTVDWDRFLGGAPRVEFDPVRFFRWRNYRDYGTGIAGDLFVHLFSGLHLVTGSLGPTRIYASGGLRYWKDGRDVPDLMVGIYDYPETKQHAAFNLQVRVNFIDGGGGGQQVALVGTEGKMVISDSRVKLFRSKLAEAPGYGGWDSFGTFDEKNQREYAAWYEQHYAGKLDKAQKSEEEFAAEPGYSDHLDHHRNFFDSVRGQREVVEGPQFGLRAAAVALASNRSLIEQRPITWNPAEMRLA